MCKRYIHRKSSLNAFDDEVSMLTATTGIGYGGFLAPPVMHCVNPMCEGRKLGTSNDPVNVTLFTIDGPRPASKISLKCGKCNANYGYSKYGNKYSCGDRFYNEERPYVEASDVVFLDRKLHQLFVCLR